MSETITLREYILGMGRPVEELREDLINALSPAWTWFHENSIQPYTFYTVEHGIHFIWRDLHRSLEYSAEAMNDSYIIVNHFSDGGQITLHEKQEYYEHEGMEASIAQLKSLILRDVS